MSTILNEDAQYLTNAGKPNVGGKIYIGDVDTDPVANPQTIYSDRELTTVLANPQTLDATGRATTKIWVDGKYSMQVNDINDVQVFQDLDRGTSTTEIGLIALTGISGGNTIIANTSPVTTAYVDKTLYSFKAVQANTGATTLNIDGVGAKAVVQNNDLALGSGRIKADDNVLVAYNSTNDNFAIVNQKTNLVGYVAKSSNYTLLPEDLGFLIDCTADLTLALTAAVTLGAGFSFFVKTNGGVITIDPNGAETIDGETTLEMIDNSYAQITCDGTNFHSVNLPSAALGYRTISTADTVVESDIGVVIDCTATLALSITAAATLKAGFFFYVKGNGGTVGIDPNGAETIDGVASKAIADGSTVLIIGDGSNFHTVTTATAAWPGQIFGLNTSIGTDTAHDIDIAIGQASSDDTLASDIVTMNLTTVITKQIDVAWAVGTAAGGLDTGTVTNDTWYHLFLIMRSDTGIVDVLFSLDPTSPTMPTGYDKKRRIGAVLTDATDNLIGYTQRGDEFLWGSVVLDVDGGTSTSTATTRTVSVPTGLKLIWNGVASIADVSITGSSYTYISSLEQDDEAPTNNIAQLSAIDTGATAQTSGGSSAALQIRTNTSAQFRSRHSGAPVGFDLSTYGWFDHRGRES